MTILNHLENLRQSGALTSDQFNEIEDALKVLKDQFGIDDSNPEVLVEKLIENGTFTKEQGKQLTVVLNEIDNNLEEEIEEGIEFFDAEGEAMENDLDYYDAEGEAMENELENATKTQEEKTFLTIKKQIKERKHKIKGYPIGGSYSVLSGLLLVLSCVSSATAQGGRESETTTPLASPTTSSPASSSIFTTAITTASTILSSVASTIASTFTTQSPTTTTPIAVSSSSSFSQSVYNMTCYINGTIIHAINCTNSTDGGGTEQPPILVPVVDNTTASSEAWKWILTGVLVGAACIGGAAAWACCRNRNQKGAYTVSPAHQDSTSYGHGTRPAPGRTTSLVETRFVAFDRDIEEGLTGTGEQAWTASNQKSELQKKLDNQIKDFKSNAVAFKGNAIDLEKLSTLVSQNNLLPKRTIIKILNELEIVHTQEQLNAIIDKAIENRKPSTTTQASRAARVNAQENPCVIL